MIAECPSKFPHPRVVPDGKHTTQIGIVDDANAEAIAENSSGIGLESEVVEDRSDRAAGRQAPQ